MKPLVCSCLAAGLAAGTGLADAAPVRVYFGTYSLRGSEGVYVSAFDPEKGRLSEPRLAAKAVSPSFLALHPRLPVLYALQEAGAPKGQPPGGDILAFRIDPATGELSELNRQKTGGAVACHIAVQPDGSRLISASYQDGTVTVFPLADDGRLEPAVQTIHHEGHSVNLKRQSGPHAHGITFSPDARTIFITDLGLDRIVGYRTNPGTGRLEVLESACASLPAGAGPRHTVFSPDGRHAYCANELDSTLTRLTWDPATLTLCAAETVTTVPPDFRGADYPGEVLAHPSGRAIYVSNRGQDCIAVFDSALKPVQWVPTSRNPRHFALTPDAAWLLAANQDGDNVTLYRVNPDDGTLTPTGTEISLPAPVCILFAPFPLP